MLTLSLFCRLNTTATLSALDLQRGFTLPCCFSASSAFCCKELSNSTLAKCWGHPMTLINLRSKHFDSMDPAVRQDAYSKMVHIGSGVLCFSVAGAV
jgi:hypothetical protein